MAGRSFTFAALVGASTLLNLSGPAQAAPRERPVHATAEDCAVMAAVFRDHDSLATLRDLLAGPIGYGPIPATEFKTMFPSLSEAEAMDLAAGAPSAQGDRFVLSCNWKRLGFGLGERWVYIRDFPWATVSRPIIGASGRIAYVNTYAQWASLAGEGRDCLLRKTGDAWRVESCVFSGIVS